MAASSKPKIEVFKTVPRIAVREASERPFDAKEIAMACELCGKVAFGKRSQMQAAMEEHKRIACTGGESNEKRVYRIWYPRA